MHYSLFLYDMIDFMFWVHTYESLLERWRFTEASETVPLRVAADDTCFVSGNISTSEWCTITFGLIY